MKYLYKNTGVIVESDKALDSAIFEPISENTDIKEPEKEAKTKRNTSKKKEN